MGISSAQLTATILSFVSTLLITQVIGRFIDHNYDKLFKELDKNLKIKGSLPEDMRSESLDQIVRQQLNAYILQRSQESMGKHVLNGVRLTIIGAIASAFFAWTVYLGLDDRPWLAGATLLGTISFGSYYFDRRRAWTRNGRVQNTKYKAILKGGFYSGGATMIDILQDSSNPSDIALDYPRVAVEDSMAGKLHIYRRTRSEGAVAIDSGENTSMVTEYEYEGTTPIDGEHPVVHNKEQAVVQPENIRTAGVDYPQTMEIPLVARPIHEAVGVGKRVARLFAS